MPSFKTSAIVSALVGAASVLGHGHVNYITIDGTQYPGYDVTSLPYKADPPKVYGWSATNTDNGFVDPASYASGDIICHKGAKNAALTAKAAAGSTIKFFWNTWPDSHKGPVIDYLAPCGSDCSTVDKSTLEFFKIHEAGLADDGTWASDDLIKDNNTWTMTIPDNTKAGLYVLRHEIIALHSAGQENGAQNYPQCFNIEVTGSGTAAPAGTLGTKLYTASEAGILVSIYNNLKSYSIPGPALSSIFGGSGSGSGSGSASSAAPSAPAATSAAAASSAPAATSAPAAATTTAAAEAVTTSAAAASSAPAATSAAAAQPTKPSCAEKRRRRLARRMAREHAVVRN